MPIQCRPLSNKRLPDPLSTLSLKCQPNINPRPISQYIANTLPIHHNPMPILCQSGETKTGPNCCQVNPFQSNLIQIRWQANTNPMPVRCQSDLNHVPIHPNPMSILCRSDVSVNALPKFRSNVNPSPISQSHGNLTIPCKSANYIPICQSHVNQCHNDHIKTDKPALPSEEITKQWIDTGSGRIGTDHANASPIGGHSRKGTGNKCTIGDRLLVSTEDDFTLPPRGLSTPVKHQSSTRREPSPIRCHHQSANPMSIYNLQINKYNTNQLSILCLDHQKMARIGTNHANPLPIGGRLCM